MAQKLTNVAVIPDGNRRYAQRSRVPLNAAYLAGFEKVQEFSSWAREEEVKTISFWALSLDNFAKRSSGELNILFKLMSNQINKALGEKDFKDQNLRVKFFGKTSILPQKVQEGIAQLEEKTKDFKEYTLNIGIAYNGREELLEASKKLAADITSGKVNPRNVDEDAFSKYLYTPENPQLIIRTGNVQRLSGFMPWQNTYSELYFSPKLWPEFTQPDFLKAKEFYETAEQRVGR